MSLQASTTTPIQYKLHFEQKSSDDQTEKTSLTIPQISITPVSSQPSNYSMKPATAAKSVTMLTAPAELNPLTVTAPLGFALVAAGLAEPEPVTVALPETVANPLGVGTAALGTAPETPAAPPVGNEEGAGITPEAPVEEPAEGAAAPPVAAFALA